MKLALLLALAVCLGGCFQTETRTAYRVTGSAGEAAVDLTVQGASASDSGLDPSAAVAGVVAAMRGDIRGLADAIKAQPPPPPPVPAAEVAAAVVKAQPPPADNAPLYTAGGTALAAMLVALLQARKAAADHKADADEAWGKLLPSSTPTPGT